jgi:hypothetical protein
VDRVLRESLVDKRGRRQIVVGTLMRIAVLAGIVVGGGVLFSLGAGRAGAPAPVSRNLPVAAVAACLGELLCLGAARRVLRNNLGIPVAALLLFAPFAVASFLDLLWAPGGAFWVAVMLWSLVRAAENRSSLKVTGRCVAPIALRLASLATLAAWILALAAPALTGACLGPR